MKKAAVIVPFYNSEKYFSYCLESLQKQDYGNFEVLLIDDCGTDGSRKIAEKYAAENPGIFHLITNDANIGQGRSRMKGIAATDADYILFVDSDDYAADDYISTLIKADTENYDCIIAGYTRDTDGKLTEYPLPDSEYTILLYPAGWGKLYKKSFIEDHRIDFSDVRKGEDIYFSLCCYAEKPKYKIIPYTGYYYRLNRISTTTSMNYSNDFEKIVAGMFSRFNQKYGQAISASMREKIEYAYAANIVNALVTYGHGCGPKQMLKKLDFVEKDIAKNYPDIMKNNSLRIFHPSGVSRKIRLGVGMFYWSRKLGFYRALFTAISRFK